MSYFIEIPSAESERREILIDSIEQLLCLRVPEPSGVRHGIPHIMTAFQILNHIALSSRRKGLNSVEFSLLHLCLRTALANRDALPCMDCVISNRVAIKITNWLHLIGFPLEINFVALNHFLNPLPDLIEPGVNSTAFDPSVSPFPGGFQKRLVNRVKADSESAIDDSALDLATDIDLQYIRFLQDSHIHRVRSVMCRNMVPTHSGWKSDS